MKNVMQAGIILVLVFLGGCATSGNSGNSEGNSDRVTGSSCRDVKCDFTGGSHTQIVWPKDLLGKFLRQPVVKYFENFMEVDEK